MKIRMVHISKSFGTKKVINDTSFQIDSGSFTTLLGASGCGKTTLLRMIAGLEKPDTGEIFFDDKCVFSSERKINFPPEKRHLGFVFQDFALWPHMTVFENVAFGLRASRRKEGLDKKVRDALHAVRLDEFADKYPHQLSGGQQQRVAFARAIVIEPECILFDEPLSALDALLREEMRIELKELVKRLGITAVFVTHDQTEAMSMSDKIAVMCKGEIEQYDIPETIYDEPETDFVAHFIGQSNWLDEYHMFRPEKASLNTIENGNRYDVEVVSSQFLGSSYQIQVKYAHEKWCITTPQRLSVGTRIPIYIDNNNIIEVKKRGN